MVVFRARDVSVLRYVFPVLVVDSGIDVEYIAEFIYGLLINRPDDICIATLFDGSKLRGMVIGIQEPFRDFIWIEQAWIDKGVKKADSCKLLELIEDWALEEFDIKELRFQTERNPSTFEKAWKFRVKGYVMTNIQENNHE